MVSRPPAQTFSRCKKNRGCQISCVAVLDLSGVFLGAPHQGWQSSSGRCEGLATRALKGHRSAVVTMVSLVSDRFQTRPLYCRDIIFAFFLGVVSPKFNDDHDYVVSYSKYGSCIWRFQLGGFLWLLDVAKDLDVSGWHKPMHCRMSQTHIVSMAKGGHECTKGCRVRAWISWSVREFGRDISMGHAGRKQDAVWNMRNRIASGVTLFVCKGVFCDFATWSRLFVPWHHRALPLMPNFAHQDIKEGLLLFHSALQDQKAYYRDLSAFFAVFFGLFSTKPQHGLPQGGDLTDMEGADGGNPEVLIL